MKVDGEEVYFDPGVVMGPEWQEKYLIPRRAAIPAPLEALLSDDDVLDDLEQV